MRFPLTTCRESGIIFFDEINFRSGTEESNDRYLRPTDIDVIDPYENHWPISAEDIEHVWGTIADLVKEGKVRLAGVSNASVGRLQASILRVGKGPRGSASGECCSYWNIPGLEI